ncbi:MAG: phosphoribosylanthranilate isomerase [Bacilli bacterium]
MTFVKICGLKTKEMVDVAVASGADALGFVFAPSKRLVTADVVADITVDVPQHIWRVGVFVNPKLHEVKAIVETAGLTHIQLHGDEESIDWKTVDIPKLIACRMEGKKQRERYKRWNESVPLFDSPREMYYGGSGHSFDWTELEGITPQKGLWFLAGGLSVENVTDAISKTGAPAVDVSSGVETEGVKDADKITAFIKKAKGE